MIEEGLLWVELHGRPEGLTGMERVVKGLTCKGRTDMEGVV